VIETVYFKKGDYILLKAADKTVQMYEETSREKEGGIFYTVTS